MKGLFKIVFCLTFVFILNTKLFAQWEQHDHSKESTNIHVINTDADLLDEITSDDKKEVIVFSKSTGEIFIPKGEHKEKRFVSVDENEKNFYESKEPITKP